MLIREPPSPTMFVRQSVFPLGAKRPFHCGSKGPVLICCGLQLFWVIWPPKSPFFRKRRVCKTKISFPPEKILFFCTTRCVGAVSLYKQERKDGRKQFYTETYPASKIPTNTCPQDQRDGKKGGVLKKLANSQLCSSLK